MKPKAGRGKLSRELVLKIVAFDGFFEQSMLFLGIMALPVDAGTATGAEAPGRAGNAGIEGLVGFAAILLVLGRRAIFLGLVAFLGLRMFLPSSRVRAMVFVFVMRLLFLGWMKSSASAMHLSMDEVLLSFVGLVLAILIKYIDLARKFLIYNQFLHILSAHKHMKKIKLLRCCNYDEKRRIGV